MNNAFKNILMNFLFVFFTAQLALADALYVDSSGKVGVGEDIPEQALHVTASSPVIRLQHATADGTSAYGYVEFNDVNSNMGYVGFGSSGNNRLYITNSTTGDVWINRETTVAAGMTVSGDLNVHDEVCADNVSCSPSDASLKKNIKSIEDPIEKIKKIRAVSFQWKNEAEGDVGETQYGVLAQEVEAVFPTFVRTRKKDGKKAVRYEGLVVPLLAAVRSQQELIEAQKEQNEMLLERIEKLEKTQMALIEQTSDTVRVSLAK